MTFAALSQLQSGQLQGCSKLSIAADLTEFPREILELAESLEILDLSGNHLRSLPDDFDRLQNLKILFISQNNFAVFPEVLGRCSKLSMVGFKANQIRVIPENALPAQLRWLILTDNQLEALPDAIGNCAKLQKLMLAGNRLKTLPDSLQNCHALELCRLAANELKELPHWLMQLPRLSWIGLGQQAFKPKLQENSRLFQWNDLTLGDRLGEGASGVIWQAKLRSENQSIASAVKVFKGAVTSDGLPEDEMQVCLAAGLHENLVGVLGEVVGHPEQRSALLLPLLNEDFRILGNPPSFESCTRDTFAEDCKFDPDFIVQVAKGIASVAAHLHDRGIMHGDLYAHNILVNAVGKPVLSDFGAASFYPTGDDWELIEVRAFGCLLEDLCDRCSMPDQIQDLLVLQNDCLNERVDDRPRFREICDRLQS